LPPSIPVPCIGKSCVKRIYQQRIYKLPSSVNNEDLKKTG